MGIAEAAHREIIIELVDRELAEAELNPTTYQLDRDFADAKLLQVELAKRIEAFDVFQHRLSQILRGDTDKQRESKAKRAHERELRKQQRLARRGQ
ncbi:hypothetical protein BASA81_004174 [Batrachochytrium salamandrivorans]|nr:hypothetical protein BASA81_004174 [Batrachochytrium salamandrivorans]